MVNEVTDAMTDETTTTNEPPAPIGDAGSADADQKSAAPPSAAPGDSAPPRDEPSARPSLRLSKTVVGRPLEVAVDDRGVERAIRKLRRILGNEGVSKEVKKRRFYMKPSDAKRKKQRDAERRRRRAARRAYKRPPR